MKKQSLVLIMLMALSVATFAGAIKVNGSPVANPNPQPNVIEWLNYPYYQTLKTSPQFLAAYYEIPVTTTTTLTIDGLDAFGMIIEASATIPAGSAYSQTPFIFNDTQSGLPVAFAQITNITQQGGTDNNEFVIRTQPEATIVGGAPLEQYLGMYESGVGVYQPGVYPSDLSPYQYTVGVGIHYIYEGVPFEPAHPDSIKVVINWADGSGATPTQDRVPQADEITGQTGTVTTSLTIQGLDQKGNPQTVTLTPLIPGYNKTVMVPGVWSTVCKVSGGSGSYFLFTEPQPAQDLFQYTLLIDHISISPASYDILAYPGPVTDGTTSYPGQTTVTVALLDIDNNPIYAADYGNLPVGKISNQIIVNFFTSAGTIQPSTNVTIREGYITATSTLTADTNPRTITVTAIAYIPACLSGDHGAFTLFAWTEMTEDGVNSANNYVWGTNWPIHTMQWGYTDSSGKQYVLNIPPKPYLPPSLGGPNPDGIKLDGPIYEVTIPLYTGCNLISSPVSPLLNGNYYTNYPTSVTETGVPSPSYPTIDNNGIPMDLLFGKTSAVGTIEAVWWYLSGVWHVYIPGVSADPTAYFRDGVGYWIKADQPCTLEISGVYLENGPFTPPTYSLKGNSWSLVGVTSINGIQTSQYLESTMGSTGIEAAGPVWEYNNPLMTNQPASLAGWQRDPSMLWPTQAFWVYNKVPTPINIAP